MPSNHHCSFSTNSLFSISIMLICSVFSISSIIILALILVCACCSSMNAFNPGGVKEGIVFVSPVAYVLSVYFALDYLLKSGKIFSHLPINSSYNFPQHQRMALWLHIVLEY